MKLKCPGCGASCSLDVLISHDGARDAVLMALQLPESLGKQILQYLGLFRPAQRELSFDRVATILGELLPMVKENRIHHKGRDWVIPRETWKAGFEAVLQARDLGTLQTPLKGHGYLLAVLGGMVDKVEAKAETRQEAYRQRGGDGWRVEGGFQGVAEIATRQGGPPPAPKPKQRMPTSVFEALKKPKE